MLQRREVMRCGKKSKKIDERVACRIDDTRRHAAAAAADYFRRAPLDEL